MEQRTRNHKRSHCKRQRKRHTLLSPINYNPLPANQYEFRSFQAARDTEKQSAIQEAGDDTTEGPIVCCAVLCCANPLVTRYHYCTLCVITLIQGWICYRVTGPTESQKFTATLLLIDSQTSESPYAITIGKSIHTKRVNNSTQATCVFDVSLSSCAG